MYPKTILVNELQRVHNLLVDTAGNLANRIKEIQSQRKPGIPITPGEFFEWAINDVENGLRNINFASLARALRQYEQENRESKLGYAARHVCPPVSS